MKKQLALFVALVMLISIIPMASFAATTDVTPGVGTLNNAFDRATSGDTLVLSDGTYYVPAQITVNKNITIEAAPGTDPVIIGGTRATGWELYEGNIYRKEHTGDVSMIIEGTQAGKIATSGTYIVSSVSGNTISSSSIPAGLKIGYAKVITYGETHANWQTTVNTITANSAGSLTFAGSTKRGVNAGAIFDLINDVSFINTPGEFAYDGEYVYYYPYDASKLETEVGIATVGTIFRVNGNTLLNLSNLNIAGNVSGSYNNYGDYVSNYAVSIYGSAVIDGCNFYGIASSAILYNGSATALTVSNCTFNGIGGTAVYLYGHGATVTNNAMVNIGTEYSGGAISVDGNNNTVSHNNISYCTRWGINMCGANSSNGYGNVIEYNDISHCNTKTSDSGLIYLYRMDGATSTKRNTIRFNAIHDSVCVNSMGFGIYLDDDSNYTDVYGNWIYNISYNTQDDGYLMGPIMIKGVGSEIHDNVIANNHVTQDYQSGAGNNNAVFVAQQLQGYNTSANKVYRNIAYNNGIAGNNRLYRVLDNDPLSNTFAYVDYNVYDKSEGQHSVSAAGAWNMSSWKSNGLDTHALFGINPYFTDAENGDFTVNHPSITEEYYQNPLRKEYIGIVSEGIVIPTMAPTEVPVTPEPVDYEGKVPVAGSSVNVTLALNTGTLENVENGVTLGTTKGTTNHDFSYFIWDEPIANKIAANKEVLISFDFSVPADNEGGDVRFGYMRNNNYSDHWEFYVFEDGTSGHMEVALIPSGQYTQYIVLLDGEQVESGTMTVANSDVWNYCWYSYWAGTMDTSMTVGNISVTEIARWEYPEGTTEAPVTEAPVTEAPVTEAPVTEAPVTEAPVTEAPVTEVPVTEAPVTEAPVTAAPTTEAPVTEAPTGELTVSKREVTVKVGKSVSVSAYLDDEDITNLATWTSNKTSVATVEDGTITGKKAGNTTVSVSYGDQIKQIQVKVTSGGGGGNGGGGISRPVPTEAPAVDEKLFNDLDSVLWAVDSIEALAKAGIVNGVAEKTFDPNGLVTREQFAKMLVEACEFNFDGAVCNFYDVVTGSWYYRYVAEAYRQGIMKGINEENMGIGMNITRQDLCTMVYRALQGMEIELPKLEEAELFTDDTKIASYAKDAVTALQMAGIIDGMGDGTFAPEETATRAQAAKIIYGVYQLIQKNK